MMCSGGKKVGYVGNGSFNSVTHTVTVDEAGEYELLVYYCTGEERGINIVVNDTDRYEMTGLSGAGFDMPSTASITISLNAGENTIKLTRNSGYAPDLDMIAVSDEPV